MLLAVVSWRITKATREQRGRYGIASGKEMMLDTLVESK